MIITKSRFSTDRGSRNNNNDLVFIIRIHQFKLYHARRTQRIAHGNGIVFGYLHAPHEQALARLYVVSLECVSPVGYGIQTVTAILVGHSGIRRGEFRIGHDVIALGHALHTRMRGRFAAIQHQNAREFRRTRLGTVASHLTIGGTTPKGRHRGDRNSQYGSTELHRYQYN